MVGWLVVNTIDDDPKLTQLNGRCDNDEEGGGDNSDNNDNKGARQQMQSIDT